MNEQQAPDRTIRGFGAARGGGGVHPDASRLLARNRTSPAPVPAVAPSANPPGGRRSGEAAPATRPSTLPTESEGGERVAEEASTAATVKTQINVMVPTDLRTRIRSAYRATSATEGHRSFSDFVAGLLEAEAKRLEARYNDGRRFRGGEQPLTPGRPLDG